MSATRAQEIPARGPDGAAPSGRAAFLGVEQSLTGRRWVGPGLELTRAAELLVQRTGRPAALCAVLARLGVTPEACDGFLAPRLRDLLPDPRRLRDASAAAARLVAAVDRGDRVAVFADYDVDGGASAALVLDWMRRLGRDATLYVPDRIDEGYGPNEPAMRALAENHDLILCVDCGTLSHAPIAAVSRQCDVVVIDHHLGAETHPDCLALVNPNRQDEDGALSHLCAAGVVFLVLVEAGRLLREAGRTGPDLLDMLDLVALATVADVAPLVGVNRALVHQGIVVMRRRARPGLNALVQVAGLTRAPDASHLGYALGPRINAGGRIGEADLGARLLSTRDPAEAEALADRLDRLNAERREIESAVTAAAIDQAEARGVTGPLVWAAGDGWHPGVVGIVASRLKERFGRPAVVIGFDGTRGQGSGRSVSGVDLGASVQRLVAEGLLTKGGGHPMAAGLSLTQDALEPAMDRLAALLGRQGAGAGGPRNLRLDGVLMPDAATPELVEHLDAAGPFGQSSAAPRFAFVDQRILTVREIGQGHLKVSFGDGLGARRDAIAFGAFDGPLGQALQHHDGARFHLAGRLERNEWRGRVSAELRLDDAAPAR